MTEKKSFAAADHAVWVSGRVTKVDLRYTASGTAILLLTLAGEDERPYYLQVKTLKEAAERWADRLGNGGAFLLAEAVLEQRQVDGRTYTGLLARRLFPVDPEATRVSEPDARGNTREAGALNLFVGRGLVVRVEERTPTLVVARMRFSPGGRQDERGYPPSVFIDVKGFGEIAEAMKTLKEGHPVFVQGRVKVDSWEGADGRRRYELRLEAQFVKPLLKELKEPPAPEEELPSEEDLPF
ncbi:single-stranded DNA-binding protein [Fervidobacterium sp.]